MYLIHLFGLRCALFVPLHFDHLINTSGQFGRDSLGDSHPPLHPPPLIGLLVTNKYAGKNETVARTPLVFINKSHETDLRSEAIHVCCTLFSILDFLVTNNESVRVTKPLST